MMKQMGNERINSIYLEMTDDGIFSKVASDRRTFIKAKYESKNYVARTSLTPEQLSEVMPIAQYFSLYSTLPCRIYGI